MALECPVCLEKYDVKTRKPKVLTCSHSICNQCLTDIVSKSSEDISVKCPTCRVSSKLDSINTNYSLLEVVEEKCEACFAEVRSTYCPHCDQQLCTGCSRQHAKAYYGIVKTKVDNLRRELLAATERSFEQLPIHNERECEEQTMASIRKAFQIKRDDLNKHENQLESEVKRISDDNINNHKQWTAKLDSQLDNCRASVRNARDKLGTKYNEKCTVDDLHEIDADVTQMVFELEHQEGVIPDSMEYRFLENESHFQKVGSVVSKPSKQQAETTRNPERREKELEEAELGETKLGETERGALSAENNQLNQDVENCKTDEMRDILIQQGLHQIADATPSQQIAFLLEERARLMDQPHVTGDQQIYPSTDRSGTSAEMLNTYGQVYQSALPHLDKYGNSSKSFSDSHQPAGRIRRYPWKDCIKTPPENQSNSLNQQETPQSAKEGQKNSDQQARRTNYQKTRDLSYYVPPRRSASKKRKHGVNNMYLWAGVLE